MLQPFKLRIQIGLHNIYSVHHKVSAVFVNPVNKTGNSGENIGVADSTGFSPRYDSYGCVAEDQWRSRVTLKTMLEIKTIHHRIFQTMVLNFLVEIYSF